MASRLEPELAAAPRPARAARGGNAGEALRVAVLVDRVAELEAAASDPSVMVSTSSIVAALESRGYRPVMVEMEAGKPVEWMKRLLAEEFDLAFNLCESVGGHSEGEHLAAASVELLGLPITGARSATLLYCLNKDHCNATLRANAIPVPDWRLLHAADGADSIEWDTFPAIVKPAAEDGSNGVHPSSVVHGRDDLAEAVERLGVAWKRLLVQEFVEGREINLAVVGRYLLPPAEIRFDGLPEDSPRIVSYEAKWSGGSPEDLGTRPVCPAPLSAEQTEELHSLAARAWRLMEGSGYGRVDVRLRANGSPSVIDVNPNPDLAPDAGLARQVRAAGWSYEDLIERIVEIALSPDDQPLSADDYVRLEARVSPGGGV